MRARMVALVVLNATSGVLWALSDNVALSVLCFALALMWLLIGAVSA